MNVTGIEGFHQLVNNYDTNLDGRITQKEVNDSGGNMALADAMQEMGPLDRYKFFMRLDDKAAESVMQDGNSELTLLFQRIEGYSPRQARAYQGYVGEMFTELDAGDQAILVQSLRRTQNNQKAQLLNALTNRQESLNLGQLPTPEDARPLEDILAQFDIGPQSDNFFESLWNGILSFFGLGPKAGDNELGEKEIKEVVVELDRAMLEMTPEDRVGLFARMTPDAQEHFLEFTAHDISVVHAEMQSLSNRELRNPPESLLSTFENLPVDQQQILLWYVEKTMDTHFVSRLQAVAAPFDLNTEAPTNQGTSIPAPNSAGATDVSHGGEELDVIVNDNTDPELA